jgi:endoglucanase
MLHHRHVLAAICIALLTACATPPPPQALQAAALPLRTLALDGQMVIANPRGERVRLKSVNWFGFESGAFVAGGLNHQSLTHIVGLIKAGGFNSVRLPWSNEMLRAERIEPQYLSANPALQGKTPLQVYDQVIEALAQAGLMVILDNHRTRGDWCCDEDHGDGLWYTPTQTEAEWLRDWAFMAGRYVGQAMVVGAELRNEIRPDKAMKLVPSWGDGVAATDWKLAAEKAAAVVSAANPELLIIVGGIGYQTDISNFMRSPPRVAARDKLVYAAHDYVWNRSPLELSNAPAFARRSFERFDALRVAGQVYSAPVYISEWGSCLQTDSAGQPCSADRVAYRQAFARYAALAQIDYAYWPLNGDQMPGYKRSHGAIETYGLLRPDWSAYVSNEWVSELNR